MKFPILSFKEGESYIYYIEKEKVLLTTTESLLKKGVFNEFIIVDSDGFVFKFNDAKKVGFVGFFGINPIARICTTVDSAEMLSVPTKLT